MTILGQHIKAWEEEHGLLPEGGWLIYRTGWARHSHSQEEILNADESGAHTDALAQPRQPSGERQPTQPIGH